MKHWDLTLLMGKWNPLTTEFIFAHEAPKFQLLRIFPTEMCPVPYVHKTKQTNKTWMLLGALFKAVHPGNKPRVCPSMREWTSKAVIHSRNLLL